MKFSLSRVMIIARREYLTTVRRKAFVFSLLLTPAILFFSTFVSTKLASDDSRAHQRQSRIVALVDSSGAFAHATTEYTWEASPESAPRGGLTIGSRTPSEPTMTVRAHVRAFTNQQEALDSLDAGTVNIVLVVAKDFMRTGAVRRYEHDTRAITSGADDGPMRAWMTRNLLAGQADSVRIERTVTLRHTLDLYVPARPAGYELKDDKRELLAFFLPFIIGFLISMSIVTGGQYLLQGVAEEKETRILESLLTTVTPDELMVGKLLGLGSAGLTLVGIWILFGLGTMGGTLALMKVEMPAMLLGIGLLYFLFAYVFYGSLMTGIGAIANNLREAQQFAMAFTIMNFVPFWLLTPILSDPNGKPALYLSLFPPTAPSTMLMRMSACSTLGQTIPAWQVATSIGLLALFAAVALMVSARIFRIGLLLYGKTPNLPEILKLLRKD